MVEVPRYVWFLTTMPKMLAELEARPESGFLGFERLGPTVNVQYWRSFEQLTAYARARDATHFPCRVRFNREIGSNGDIGIWHETYLVRAGQYEAVYNNMPLHGLAKAAGHVDAVGNRMTAAGRVGQNDGSDAPVEPDGRKRRSA
jgi:hypothetical protein